MSKDQKALMAVAYRAKDEPFNLISWADPLSIGLLNLHSVDTNLFGNLRPIVQSLLRRALKLSVASRRNPFGLAHEDIIWGSNRLTASAGLLLLRAFQTGGQRNFLKSALVQANYLLGANPQDMSFVTGTGIKSPQNTHHRFAQSLGHRVPGQLVGGPNNEDGIFEADLLSYTDAVDAFQSNEFAIEYNAVLLHFLNELEGVEPRPAPKSLWHRLFG
jgi:endoglucanase